tara:strand:- start:404 stop:565 length:162 start_codon:yes stop_codon:yes gene_type:complete
MKIGDLVKYSDKIGVVMDIIDEDTIHVLWGHWPENENIEETGMCLVEYVDSLF